MTTKTNLKARPTLYRDQMFRSRLEALWAAWFDFMGFNWAYEPYCFGSVRGQYLPDFRITRAPGDPAWWVEIKPDGADLIMARKRMEIIWEQLPDAVLIVATEKEVWVANLAGQGRSWQLYDWPVPDS